MIGGVQSFCDDSRTAMVQEGNIGQSFVFSWIGALRVHLHDGDKPQVAITGVILIKKEFALVNADDIVKIPDQVFREHSTVMFIGSTDRPWYVVPKGFELHPEYQVNTFNTIAILELDINVANNYPVRPICWPNVGKLNTSSALYVTGYTDENLLLEKMVYKVKYLENSICADFYERAGLGDKFHQPVHYICGYAQNNTAECVWDNGMALVTNVSGYFTLLGFGIRGPGCKAPARFVDLRKYYTWMEATTSPIPQRRTAVDVPVHETFIRSARKSGRGGVPIAAEFRQDEIYPFDIEGPPKMFTVEEIDNTSIAIFPFKNTLELYEKACNSKTTIIYAETFRFHSAMGHSGMVYYKVSLFDLVLNNCTCIQIVTSCPYDPKATFAYKEYIDIETEKLDPPKTPEEVQDRYPPHGAKYQHPGWSPDYGWEREQLLTEEAGVQYLLAYELYIKFPFTITATMTIRMYGNRTEYEDDASDEVTERIRDMTTRTRTTTVRRRGPQTEFPYEYVYDDTFDGKYPKYDTGNRTYNSPFKIRSGIVPLGLLPDAVKRMFLAEGDVPSLAMVDIDDVVTENIKLSSTKYPITFRKVKKFPRLPPRPNKPPPFRPKNKNYRKFWYPVNDSTPKSVDVALNSILAKPRSKGLASELKLEKTRYAGLLSELKSKRMKSTSLLSESGKARSARLASKPDRTRSVDLTPELNFAKMSSVGLSKSERTPDEGLASRLKSNRARYAGLVSELKSRSSNIIFLEENSSHRK
ncbi:uncharacterized protein LOC142983011 [Anticarsia gemmatalis]|uniref:uncharacterized protein LOC142983011 n=1 Tax=Anticarsia gemmatalis TaxID=129554 RepID=UPI003F776E82